MLRLQVSPKNPNYNPNNFVVSSDASFWLFERALGCLGFQSVQLMKKTILGLASLGLFLLCRQESWGGGGGGKRPSLLQHKKQKKNPGLERPRCLSSLQRKLGVESCRIFKILTQKKLKASMPRVFFLCWEEGQAQMPWVVVNIRSKKNTRGLQALGVRPHRKKIQRPSAPSSWTFQPQKHLGLGSLGSYCLFEKKVRGVQPPMLEAFNQKKPMACKP